MSIEKHLASLAYPTLVETVYLAGRYLTHRLTRDRFLRQLTADVEAPARKTAVASVLEIVRDIERSEGAAIENLPNERLSSYAEELDGILRRRIERSAHAADAAEVDEALSLLRETA